MARHDALLRPGGDLTQNGSQTYSWDARGQLTGTAAGSSTFSYDAFGRRSTSTVAGTGRRYIYDGWNTVQEQDGTGAVFANSIFGLGPDEIFWRKPVAASSGSNYLRDGLRSTVALTNPSGASNTTYAYEPYGKPTAGDLTNPFTFTAREWDATVGLQLNRARYYSPSNGRFVSEDPLGEWGSLNLYQYAAAAPTAITDPFGLEEDCGFLRLGCLDAREWLLLALDVVAFAAGIAAGVGFVTGAAWVPTVFAVATIANWASFVAGGLTGGAANSWSPTSSEWSGLAYSFTAGFGGNFIALRNTGAGLGFNIAGDALILGVDYYIFTHN